MIYPSLNENLKQKNDYTFFERKEKKKMEKSIEKDLNDMFDDLKDSFSNLFSGLICFVKATQVKKSIYVLIRKKRGKILGDKRQELFEQVKNISEDIYYNYQTNN